MATEVETIRTRPAPFDAEEPDLGLLLRAVAAEAAARAGTDAAAVFLRDEETGDLYLDPAGVVGALLPATPTRFLRSGPTPRGLAFRALELGEPFHCPDVTQEPEYVPIFDQRSSHLSVPITILERPIGVLLVESSAEIPAATARAEELVTLAAAVSPGVRRAQIFRATFAPNFMPGSGILVRGLSPTWREAVRRIERASDTNATVLLRGESGTGKEVVAHAIHYASPRARKQFVVVNCAAIPEGLLESELFGHVRGSFTGAVADRRGRFEEADGGTIFLDEVGEMTPALQVKLLRVLQTGEVTKVGGSGAARKVEVRVIAATSRPLEKMLRDGTFREDLFYRLNVVSIRLPALREYRDAIPEMARTFLEEFAIAYGRPVCEIQPAAVDALLRYGFPGNVRELRNLMEQGVVLESGSVLRAGALPDEVRFGERNGGAPSGGPASFRDAELRFQREYLSDLLERTTGDVTRAASTAGMHRVHLYRLLRRHGMSAADFRSAEAKLS